MAICYHCGYGPFYEWSCPKCGKKCQYYCWKCKNPIVMEHKELCKKCKWIICGECESCGCQKDRPDSKEEEAGFRERK